jgi:hypothetical protein
MLWIAQRVDRQVERRVVIKPRTDVGPVGEEPDLALSPVNEWRRVGNRDVEVVGRRVGRVRMIGYQAVLQQVRGDCRDRRIGQEAKETYVVQPAGSIGDNGLLDTSASHDEKVLGGPRRMSDERFDIP